jgi:hypothetical protein
VSNRVLYTRSGALAAPILVQRLEGQLTEMPDKRRRWQRFDTPARCVRMMSLMLND